MDFGWKTLTGAGLIGLVGLGKTLGINLEPEMAANITNIGMGLGGVGLAHKLVKIATLGTGLIDAIKGIGKDD